MQTRQKPRASASPALLAAPLAVLGAVEAQAQSVTCGTLNPPCTNHPPFVTVDPRVGTFGAPSVSIQDDRGVKGSTFLAKLNGTVIQSGGATSGVSSSVMLALNLAPGQNTLEVSACDSGCQITDLHARGGGGCLTRRNAEAAENNSDDREIWYHQALQSFPEAPHPFGPQHEEPFSA